VLGSQLVNKRTGEIVWPGLQDAKDDSLALPIDAANLADNRDDLVASEIVMSAPLIRFLPEISVYNSLLRTLEDFGGYKHGDFDNPIEGGDHDTYYIFAYDWRRDNVESAQLLMQKIVRLKERLNRPDLKFDVIAHSMGGLVARYAAMYGDRDVLNLPGELNPDWAGAKHFSRLMMFGTPNLGSMDAMGTLLLGYSVLGSELPRLKLISKLDRDTVFTIPSTYQLLPHQDNARFYDRELQPLKIDIYDVEVWRQYGWSIACDKEFIRNERKQLLKKRKGEKGEAITAQVDEEIEHLANTRTSFLKLALERAKNFHRALDVMTAPPDSMQWYLFGGDCEPTLDGVVICEVKGKLMPFFRVSRAIGNKTLRRRAESLMFSPGDGRVTRRSLFGLPHALPKDLSADIAGGGSSLPRVVPRPAQAIFHCEVHGDLPLNSTVQNNLLTVLLGNSY
ncbi:MAG TPA: hypothetical protein VEF04_11275, partial [Blastocatellia bacterium]|nr:hypothetical protein [Blastocatellia bacterium]